MTQEYSANLEQLIDRSNRGDQSARQELFDRIYQRCQLLTRKMLQGYPGVRRWEQTDDVWQTAGIKLWKSLERVDIQDAAHFHSLAAMHIRRTLIDLLRQHFGGRGIGKHHASLNLKSSKSTDGPSPAAGLDETYESSGLAEWTDFHAGVEKLPDAEREVFDLVWYHGMSQNEAAGILKISLRTVKRRWLSARLKLANILGHGLPE